MHKQWWVRGETVGRGSFAKVNLAKSRSEQKNLSASPIAVKTATTSDFPGAVSSLQNEEEILLQLQGCPQIITCLGADQTVENGTVCHNLFLEYAEDGSLADRLKSQPSGRFSLPEIRTFTHAILQGLCFIHERGFAHCDIKLQNILCFANGEVKISDFGLSRNITINNEEKMFGFVGTPLYMSPEAATGSTSVSVAPAADIWALGCAVVEMATGKPLWGSERRELAALIHLIASGNNSPVAPEEELGEEGKDFVEKCFIRDPNQRWTAQMLLNHPFVSSSLSKTKMNGGSPRGPFDFQESDSPSTSPLGSENDDREIFQWGGESWAVVGGQFSWDELEEEEIVDLDSGLERIAALTGHVSDLDDDWSVSSSDWITVR